MAAIDFPAAPAVNQIFAAPNGVNYMWTGALWVVVGGRIEASPGGDFFAYGTAGQMAPPVAGTWFVMKPGTVYSGNSGGWYDPTTGRFTPPAGRYRLIGQLTFNSSGQSIQGYMRWNKNGVVVIPANGDSRQDTAGANYGASVTSEVIVDANGTDYFECTMQSWTVLFSVAYGYIGAFPLSGVKGPPGDPGQLGFRLLQRTVISVAQPDVSIQGIPTDINDIRIGFDLVPVTNDVNLCLQFYNAAGVLQSAGGTYGWANTINWNTNASTSVVSTANNNTSGVSNSIVVSYGIVPNGGVNNGVTGGVSGEIRVANIRAATRPKHAVYQSSHLAAGAGYIAGVSGGGWLAANGAISGARLVFGAGNIAAGGVMSVWGSP